MSSESPTPQEYDDWAERMGWDGDQGAISLYRDGVPIAGVDADGPPPGADPDADGDDDTTGQGDTDRDTRPAAAPQPVKRRPWAGKIGRRS